MTMFSWASVSILDFLDQKEKFTISVTCFTKLTLAAVVWILSDYFELLFLPQ